MDVANNTISGNLGNAITVTENSSVVFELPGVIIPNRTDPNWRNEGFGVSCTIGGSVSKTLGTLLGVKGAVDFTRSCADATTR